jgi:hypothetical protein
VPNPDGDDPPFVCGGECVPSGGTCTVTADCCRGITCSFPPGSTRGTCGDTGTGGTGGMGGTNTGGNNTGGNNTGGNNTGGNNTGGNNTGGNNTGGNYTGGTGGACSAYGQACEMTSDCCNGVPCTNGFCVDNPR